MAIPFAGLRFDPTLDTWGLNVRRLIRHKNEEVFWSPIPLEADLFRLSLAGNLTGMSPPPPSLNLWVKPFGIASAGTSFVQTGREDPDDTDAGLDIKWGVGRNLSLDLTYNTDFAQVEVDDEQINLTRFPLFFPEKRDFFLENAGTFAFGTPREMDLFFSRRIGIEDGFEVPILVGGRLSGKIDRFQLGLLGIQTGEEEGVAPGQNFFVGRVRREFHNRSSAGFIFTNRESMADPQGKTE